MVILIFYWLLPRPRIRELQLVSYSFGKFRPALQETFFSGGHIDRCSIAMGENSAQLK